MSGPYERVRVLALGHYDQFLSLHATAAVPTFLAPPLPDLAIPGYEYDSVLLSGELQGHSSSGCSSYLDSPNSNSITTYGAAHSPTMIHSFLNRNNLERYHNMESENSYGSIADSQSVQQYKWSNSVFESMNRATPYSPEEKKERIERYRSKRNLRNFNKKIKYECRKTLADSRPRVRGRFAKNHDYEREKQSSEVSFEEEEDDDDDDDDDDYYSWVTILEAFNKSDALISSF